MNNNYLSELHPHSLDDNIEFIEDGHIYNIKGTDIKPVSTTTLIHKYFEPFDADKIITNMMSSKNWHKSEYYGMTPDEIKYKWSQSAPLGTAMHLSIELFFNNGLLPEQIPTTKEFTFFLQWYSDFFKLNPDWKPYRTEWFIFDPELIIAGSIDFCLVNPNGEIWIIDWKRSKSIRKTNRWQKGKGLLSHLEDCNYIHYSLQQNIYRDIIERHYGKKVIAMDLLVLHPNNNNYIPIRIDRMEEEIELIRENRREEISNL